MGLNSESGGNKQFDSVTTGKGAVDDAVIRVYGLPSGGSYREDKISDFADLLAAVDSALDDMETEYGNGTRVELPAIGRTFPSGSPISIPDYTDGTSVAIVGPNEGKRNDGLRIEPESGFSGSAIISGGNEDSGLVIKGIKLFASNSWPSGSDRLIDLSDMDNIEFENLHLFSNQSGIDRYINVDQPNGTTDFLSISHVALTGISDNQTGIDTFAGQMHLEDVDLRGDQSNPSGSIGLNMRSGDGDISVFVAKLDKGVQLDESANAPLQGGLINIRSEKPGTEVNHPIYNKGWYGLSVRPLNNPGEHIRHSVDAGWIEWLTPAWHRHPASLYPGYGSAPDMWTANNIFYSNGKFRLDAPSGSTAELTTDNPVYQARGGGDITDLAPEFRANARADIESTAGATYRIGLVDSMWTDWAGLYYDADDSSKWLFKVVNGGSDVISEDTGIAPGTGELVKGKYHAGDRLSLAVRQTDTADNDVAWTTTTMGSAFSSLSASAHLDNGTGDFSAFDIWEFSLHHTDPKAE